MSQYRIEFIPLEPYFFGNEKSSNFDQNENKTQKSGSYFTRSEKWPSQSSLFGVLRLIGLRHFNEAFKYNKEQRQANAAAVGAKSFDLATDQEQNFGTIKSLSPVFITTVSGGEKKYLIKMPLNHRVMDEEQELKELNVKSSSYKPFRISKSTDQELRLPENYDAKAGLSSAFLAFKLTEQSPEIAEIIENETIFGTVVKTRHQNRRRSGWFLKKRIYFTQLQLLLCLFCRA